MNNYIILFIFFLNILLKIRSLRSIFPFKINIYNLIIPFLHSLEYMLNWSLIKVLNYLCLKIYEILF